MPPPTRPRFGRSSISKQRKHSPRYWPKPSLPHSAHLAGTRTFWRRLADPALGVRHGLSLEAARSQAWLGLAVTRGLLLDLLATGDLAAVDEAAELFFADCARRFQQDPKPR